MLMEKKSPSESPLNGYSQTQSAVFHESYYGHGGEFSFPLSAFFVKLQLNLDSKFDRCQPVAGVFLRDAVLNCWSSLYKTTKIFSIRCGNCGRTDITGLVNILDHNSCVRPTFYPQPAASFSIGKILGAET